MLARANGANRRRERRDRRLHLSSLYSRSAGCRGRRPSRSSPAKENPDALKNWVNSVLGRPGGARRHGQPEPARPAGAMLRRSHVGARRLRRRPGRPPRCAVKATARESWLIAYSRFHGDPGREAVWLDLDRFLRQEFTHESGQKVPIACVAVDSRYHSEQVYRFCRARIERRVFAVRGGAERGKPVVGRPSDNNRYHAKLFTLCVDTAKEIVFSRLRIGGGHNYHCQWIDAVSAHRRRTSVAGSESCTVHTSRRASGQALDSRSHFAAPRLSGPFVILPPAGRRPSPPTPPPQNRAHGPGADPARWINGWRGWRPTAGLPNHRFGRRGAPWPDHRPDPAAFRGGGRGRPPPAEIAGQPPPCDPTN
jgi:hypothetical protein